MAINGTFNATLNATMNASMDAVAQGGGNVTVSPLANSPIDPFAVMGAVTNHSSVAFAQEYARQLPALAIAGDFFALVMLFILGFITLVVLNKISGVLLTLIRHAIVFIITGFGAFFFYRGFQERVAEVGYTTEALIFGALGVAVGITGLIFSIYWLVLKLREEKYAWPEPTPDQTGARGVERKKLSKKTDYLWESDEVPDEEFKDLLKWQTLTDKSFLSVLTFMVVAQFGVFSSKTIAAPNAQVGMFLFIFFILASFFFIRQSYRSYPTGLLHLFSALILGFTLSVFLGNAWSQVPWGDLLSWAYFQSDSLIALISGMALSLFAGSKS